MITKTFGNGLVPVDVVVQGQGVSKLHAKITYLGGNDFTVEDTNSTNSTFVNGYKIIKAKASIKDEVRLSIDGYVDLAAAFNISKSNKAKTLTEDDKLYTEEFMSLKPIWYNYQKDKAKANRDAVLKSNGIRGAIMLGIMYLGFGPLKDALNTISPGGSMMFTTIGGLVGVAATSGMNANDKLQELYEDFSRQYVCHNPKCQRPLVGMSWEHYKKVGKCPSCQLSFKKQ